jgi:hypothetical protein
VKLVYNEWYGTLSYAQRAAYRKYNVTPADHRELEQLFGDDHAAITKAVKEQCARTGRSFSSFDLGPDHG